MLFVPSGGAVAWRAKGAEDEAVVARFCYVDASNFNDVKAQLPLYAAVEASHHLHTSANCVYGQQILKRA